MRDFTGAGASRGSDGIHNEDGFLCDDSAGLYVICDGLSSQPGGEVAAYLALTAVVHYLTEVEETGALASECVTLRIVDEALQYALQCIADAVEIRPDLGGMATTITLLLVQGHRGLVGHVGDSRVYLIRDGRCVQLTADQEWTETEGTDERHPISAELWSETFGIEVEPDDLFVLCTDGAEQELERPDWLREAQSASPRLLASRIVSAAHRRDAEADATVVVVRLREDGTGRSEGGGRARRWIQEAHAIDRGPDGSVRPPVDRARYESVWERGPGSTGESGSKGKGSAR